MSVGCGLDARTRVPLLVTDVEKFETLRCASFAVSAGPDAASCYAGGAGRLHVSSLRAVYVPDSRAQEAFSIPFYLLTASEVDALPLRGAHWSGDVDVVPRAGLVGPAHFCARFTRKAAALKVGAILQRCWQPARNVFDLAGEDAAAYVLVVPLRRDLQERRSSLPRQGHVAFVDAERPTELWVSLDGPSSSGSAAAAVAGAVGGLAGRPGSPA